MSVGAFVKHGFQDKLVEVSGVESGNRCGCVCLLLLLLFLL